MAATAPTATGKCSHCTKPAAPGRQRCERCIAIAADYDRVRRHADRFEPDGDRGPAIKFRMLLAAERERRTGFQIAFGRSIDGADLPRGWRDAIIATRHEWRAAYENRGEPPPGFGAGVLETRD